LGLSINDYRGMRNYGHGGSWGGYVCQITYFPNQRFGLIFVSNREPSGVYVDQDVYNIFLGEISSDQIPAKEEIVSRTEVEIEPDIIEEYVGIYTQASRIIKVEKASNGLVIHLPWEQNIRVYPESDDKFFAKDANVQYSFQRDGDSQVNQLTIHTQRGEFEYGKLDSRVSGHDDVEELLGEYYSDELETTYGLEIRDDQLIVEHFQNEEVLLARLDQDHYVGDKWWFSEVEFIRNQDNSVVGFRLNADQNNIQNLLFVKE
jgi:hypothetical protein